MSVLAAKNAEFRGWQEDIARKVAEGDRFVLRGNRGNRIGLAEGDPLKAPDEVWDYDPAAMTLTVSTGTDLALVESVLAKENQRLAFEPTTYLPLRRLGGIATVGGMIAMNRSGPRRVAVGACRDHCLGLSFIDGCGQIISNGGRVMKNVTGYDLVKLLVGSHGTLGLITEVSLKTQAIPECGATVVLDGLGEAQAVAAMSAALGTPYDVTGAAHVRRDGDGTPAQTYLRLEGFESSVTYRSRELVKVLAEFGAARIEADPDKSEKIWEGVRNVTRMADNDDDLWSVSVKPSDAPALIAAVEPVDAMLDWGGGRVWLRCVPATDVRAAMVGMGGHATLIRASDATKRALGVFHPENKLVAKLSAQLRHQFDPEQKFNRGMMG